MRITSVTLRNCRVHRELKVDFDASRTLIGGPNETGKSTLIEAVHRAMFLRAKGNTELHRAMISTLHLGHPEVELAFEAGGVSYLLKKRFGPNGTSTLESSNSPARKDDDAESELARVLRVEAGLTGKASVVQWAHLWVWQGEAGEDPSTHATAQQHGLLQRLQQMGGAAALQSELDARVAGEFANARDQIYTQAGKPKAGSELERAQRADASARDQVLLASDRLRKLESAAMDLENASRTLDASSTSLTDLEKQKEAVEAKALKLVELRQLETEQSHAAKAAVARHNEVESANQQILMAREGISELEGTLRPQDEAIAQAEKYYLEAKSRAASAEEVHRAATDAVRTARFRHDLASARALLFEKTETHAKLRKKEERVAKSRRDLSELEEQLAKLPKVDKAKLAEIQKLESECSNARSALQAMATGFEVIAADAPVNVGGQSIGVGHRQILTEDTEVQIGTTTRVRVQPGGGIGLAGARQSEADALRRLQATLDSCGLQSVKEAMEARAGRDDLGSRSKAARAELDGLGAEHLAEELQASLNELTAAQSDVNRLAAAAPDVPVPGDKSEAVALTKELVKELTVAEERETKAKTSRETSTESLQSSVQLLATRKTETELLRHRLTGLKAQLELLLRTHGDDTARTTTLMRCQDAKIKAENDLKTTAGDIAALQPELLEADRNRIKRAIATKTSEKNEAEKQIAVARAALSSDGLVDPTADLATAQAKARSAEEHHRAVQRRSQAIDLLDRLFQEEQRSLAEQFTQPLAARISGYLQCIFGAGACAQVDLENSEFTGLRLSRPGYGVAPFAFDALSGGAKEQTAAAVRLAMAEVLAQDFDGCLPVVFDDAFAYSDPDRVNQVQRMLDLAATRGLQIIVLTCNPADYAWLGAKTVALRSGRAVLDHQGHPAPEVGLNSPDPASSESEDELLDDAASVAVTDEQRQSLLSALSTLGGSKGNQTLREHLGWETSTYNAVKNALVAEGKLIPGRGRGGSVSLTQP